MSNIDWSVIDKYELTASFGYTIPGQIGDKSGVTVASGVDLGQYNARELEAWNLGPELTERLRPFLGAKGVEARNKLYTTPRDDAFRPGTPLSAQIRAPVPTRVDGTGRAAVVRRAADGRLDLSNEDIAAIDSAVRRSRLQLIERHYDDDSAASGKPFKTIPASCQTAITSFCFQFGPNVGAKPTTDRRRQFWDQVVRADWPGAMECLLEKFLISAEKAFETRRLEEVILLARGCDQPWGPRMNLRFQRWSDRRNIV